MPVLVKGGGGGSKPYAFILATFPSGSTCTCSNAIGKKIISATQVLFYIKEAGSYTVSCTNGTNTDTKTVTITFEGQSVLTTLSYNYVLFDGSASVDVLGETSGRYVDITTRSTTLVCKADGNVQAAVGYLYFATLIDVSNYSTLKVNASATNASGIKCGFSATNSGSPSTTNFITVGTTEQNYTADISSLSGQMYFSVYFAIGNQNKTLAFNSIVLECA